MVSAEPMGEMKDSQKLLLKMFSKTREGEEILGFFFNIYHPGFPSMPFIGQTFPVTKKAWKMSFSVTQNRAGEE